jgi:hypothetical protein
MKAKDKLLRFRFGFSRVRQINAGDLYSNFINLFNVFLYQLFNFRRHFAFHLACKV